MPWSKPDFVEIPLAMEVTAYANTDDAVDAAEGPEGARGARLGEGRRQVFVAELARVQAVA